MHLCRYFFCVVFSVCSLYVGAQERTLDYFIQAGVQKNPKALESSNLQQNFAIQRELITAQNKKPQVSFTADYLFAPFFFDNGKAISITPDPSPKAYGYDASITNGGLYSAQLNAVVPLFNSAILNALYAQNDAEAAASKNTVLQATYDAQKAITEQYILTYQFQQQEVYLQRIADRLADRKPLVAALVKKGLLQQNDYLLLDIQLANAINDVKQMRFNYRNGLEQLKALALLDDTTNFKLAKPVVDFNPDPDGFFSEQKFRADSMTLVTQENVFNNKYRPQVSLTGTTGINAVVLQNIPHNIGMSAAVHVGIPISDGHQRKLNARSIALQITNAQIERDNAVFLRRANLRAAKLQIEQWRESAEMSNEPIRRQEVLLDIIRDKVIQGQVSVMDYVIALQDYAVMLKNRAVAESSVLLYINQYNYYNH